MPPQTGQQKYFDERTDQSSFGDESTFGDSHVCGSEIDRKHIVFSKSQTQEKKYRFYKIQKPTKNVFSQKINCRKKICSIIMITKLHNQRRRRFFLLKIGMISPQKQFKPRFPGLYLRRICGFSTGKLLKFSKRCLRFTLLGLTLPDLKSITSKRAEMRNRFQSVNALTYSTQTFLTGTTNVCDSLPLSYQNFIFHGGTVQYSFFTVRFKTPGLGNLFFFFQLK